MDAKAFDETPQTEMTPFQSFWNLYPRKVARKDAERAWKKLTATEKVRALEALPKHIEQWAEMEFVPYPATWLNGARWEDEFAQNKRLRIVAAWWSSDEGTLQRGREMGIPAKPGESMSSYRARLKAA